MAVFYYHRGNAALQLGYIKQSLDDLRTALIYSERSGGYLALNDILRDLGDMEAQFGNVHRGIELLRKLVNESQSLVGRIVLTQVLIRMGDLDEAEKVAIQGSLIRNASLADNYRIRWRIPEARGNYAEAEQLIRKEIEARKDLSLLEKTPRRVISARRALSDLLSKTNRPLEAEIEARQTVKEALGVGGMHSDMTDVAVLTLAKVMLNQGRISEAEKLVRVISQSIGSLEFASDSFHLNSVQTFLGNVLAKKSAYPEAMNGTCQ